MKLLKALCTCTVLLFTTTACAGNQAAQDYYVAMAAAAENVSRAQEAKFLALSQLAGSSDPGAATAAVMAIALTQDKVVAPQYVESSALKWAQVLTPAVSTLGLGAIQAAVSMNSSDNSKDIQMASFASNEAIQLGQQTMVTDLGTSWAGAAATAGGGAIEVALAGFDALNTAGGQTADVAVAGFDANTTIAGLGFATADSIATTGFTTVDSVATTGISTVGAVGVAGMAQVGATAQIGMDNIETVGLAGMTNLTTLGTTGMTNLTTLGTTGMGLVDTQGSNYSAIIADMQNSIDLLGAELADPITCSPNADGLYVCQ